MKVGLFGFGRAGKAVATELLQNEEVFLCWVIRKSKNLQHRSVPEFLGIERDEDDQGLIFAKDEWTPAQLFDKHPVDAIIDFSSADAVLSMAVNGSFGRSSNSVAFARNIQSFASI